MHSSIPVGCNGLEQARRSINIVLCTPFTRIHNDGLVSHVGAGVIDCDYAAAFRVLIGIRSAAVRLPGQRKRRDHIYIYMIEQDPNSGKKKEERKKRKKNDKKWLAPDRHNVPRPSKFAASKNNRKTCAPGKSVWTNPLAIMGTESATMGSADVEANPQDPSPGVKKVRSPV